MTITISADDLAALQVFGICILIGVAFVGLLYWLDKRQKDGRGW